MSQFSPIKKEILRAMNEYGRPVTPSEIAKIVPVSSTTILTHLQELQKEGAVQSEVRNNKKYWTTEYF